MHGQLAPANDRELTRGINWPRLYDFLLLMMTRGRDDRYREEVLDLAALASGDHLLDIGCGTGTQAIAAYRRVRPAGAVIGIDVSANMLAAARRKARRAGGDIFFEQADAAALPFADDAFDAVTMTTVLHMVPESRRRLSLREAFRVLKPGGRLLVIDYAGDVAERRGVIAKHGLHGAFDLHRLQEPLSQEGFANIEGGPLRWLSLHFLRGVKR